jgi:hypothetical protein
MTHPADYMPAINRVLAEIKTPGTTNARVRELQREYRQLERAYAAAARAVRASVPMFPA